MPFAHDSKSAYGCSRSLREAARIAAAPERGGSRPAIHPHPGAHGTLAVSRRGDASSSQSGLHNARLQPNTGRWPAHQCVLIQQFSATRETRGLHRGRPNIVIAVSRGSPITDRFRIADCPHGLSASRSSSIRRSAHCLQTNQHYQWLALRPRT